MHDENKGNGNGGYKLPCISVSTFTTYFVCLFDWLDTFHGGRNSASHLALAFVKASTRSYSRYKKMYISLLNKPYWNRVSLSQDYISTLKVTQKPWTLVSKQIWSRSLNEVLNIDFDLGSPKISEVKIEDGKNIYQLTQTWAYRFEPGWVGRYLFRPPTLISDIFAPPWSKSMFSTSFERSFSYLFADKIPRLLSDF